MEKQISQQINNFYSVIKTKVDLTKQAKALFAKTLSPDFNAFDFWYINENKISEILAFLINPQGSHGQGDTFLKLFVKHLNLDFEFSTHDKIEVECEHYTNLGRKIDIVVKKNGKEKIIGVENKIYSTTADQNNQIKHYLDYLSKYSIDYCLFYLAPAEKRIGEHSLSTEDFETFTANNKLRMISYEFDIIDIVHAFALHCESERVRFFVLEFEKKLRQMFMGEDSINDNEFIKEYILASTENLELSFKIMNGLNNVKAKLQEKFELQLKEIADEFGLKAEGTSLVIPGWKKYYIGFSYESGGIIYGIVKHRSDNVKTNLNDAEQVLLPLKFKTSVWWPLWEYFYDKINHKEDFYLDIQSGKAKERAHAFVKTLQPLFNRTDY